MDFILVADALEAHTVRFELAKRNQVDVLVGTFTGLLDQLANAWLLDLPYEDWSDKLQQEALTSREAFWAQSISVDEPAVCKDLERSLRQLFNAKRLGVALPLIAEPAQRFERYYNDLVRLSQRVGFRPNADEIAEIWLRAKDDQPIKDLRVVTLINSDELELWQQDLLSELDSLGRLSTPDSKYSFLRSEQSEDDVGPFVRLSETLFSYADILAPNEALHVLTCRDVHEEIQAVTSMIQKAIAAGEDPQKIAVVCPISTDHSMWLERSLKAAGQVASNLSSATGVLDWQTSLIHDLLNHLVMKAPAPMMSALINPLMPWSKSLGFRLASQLKQRNPFEFRTEQETEEYSEALTVITGSVPSDISEVIPWLNNIALYLREKRSLGLTAQRFELVVGQVERLFALHSDQSLEDCVGAVLPQLRVAPLAASATRERFINGVTVIEEHESLPFEVDELFIVGFNEGAHTYHSAHTGPISRQNWDKLAKLLDLSLPSEADLQSRWQVVFSDRLRKVGKGLTITRSLCDYAGNYMEPSETLIDLAMCFQKADALDPAQLETPLYQSNHPLLRTHDVEVTEPVSVELEDLQFEPVDLENMLQTQDGTRRSESPSSLERLMQSPLAWLLDRSGIRSQLDDWKPQTPDVLLRGSVAHKCFEHAALERISGNSNSPNYQLFAQAVAELAPFLNQPQWRMKRSDLEKTVCDALEEFEQWRIAEGWHYESTEQELKGTLWGIPVRGFADGILSRGKEHFIVDYKTSQHDKRIQQLNQGFDLQTMIYRELYLQSNPGVSVDSGYYTLNDQTLVCGLTPGQPSSAVTLMNPSTPLNEQSAGADTLVQSRLAELANGQVLLNRTDDAKVWDKRGVSAYALENNPIVKRFTVPAEDV